MKKVILISAGCTSLSLGVVGIFVPLLPTTPFLLLAAACFLRSSERLYTWLTHHWLLGDYIRCYIRYRAISVKARVLGISLLWLFIGYSAVFVAQALWLRALLLLIALGVTIHLVGLKTLTKEMREKARPEMNT